MSKEDVLNMKQALDRIPKGIGTDDDYAVLNGRLIMYQIKKNRMSNPTSWEVGANALEEDARAEMRENDPYFKEYEWLERHLEKLIDKINYKPTRYSEDNTEYWNDCILLWLHPRGKFYENN